MNKLITKKDNNELDDRIYEIKSLFNDIANLLGIKEVNNIFRWNISEERIEIWDFFQAFHSEISSDNTEIRCYIIHTEDSNYIIPLWNISNIPNNVIKDYKILNFEEIKSVPWVIEKVSKIKEIELDYRNEVWLTINAADEKVHKLLDL